LRRIPKYNRRVLLHSGSTILLLWQTVRCSKGKISLPECEKTSVSVSNGANVFEKVMHLKKKASHCQWHEMRITTTGGEVETDLCGRKLSGWVFLGPLCFARSVVRDGRTDSVPADFFCVPLDRRSEFQVYTRTMSRAMNWHERSLSRSRCREAAASSVLLESSTIPSPTF
jgi:hypothetical protein